MILNSSEAIFLPLITALQTPGSPVGPQATDTVIAILPPQGIQAAIDVAALVLIIVLVALFVGILYVGIGLLRTTQRTVATLENYRVDLAPVIDRGRAVAENVEFVSNVARRDFERIRGHLDGLAERLGEASEDMEDRIHEFNALLEVVQGEAEDLFLDAAATVRGVQTGARELGPGSGAHDESVTPADQAVRESPDS
jgi:hypothetical protein